MATLQIRKLYSPGQMLLDAFVLVFSHTQYYSFAVQQIANTQIHTVNQLIPKEH